MATRNSLPRIPVLMVACCLIVSAGQVSYAQLELLGSCQLPEESRFVQISGNYAFVSGTNEFLGVVDISQPGNPEIVAYYDSTGDPWGMSNNSGYVFIAGDGYGLQIIDVTDPLHPTLAGIFDGYLYEHDVDAQENIAFLLTCQSMYVVDITDPAYPVEISHIETNSVDNLGIFVEGNYAYISVLYYGALIIVDISNPENPVLRGSYPDLQISSEDLLVRYAYAYIPTSDNIKIIDISDPDNPSLVGNCNPPYHANGLCSEDNYMFTISNIHGLTVMDISDPVFPLYIDHYETYGYGYRDVACREGLIVALRDSQLDIFAFGPLDVNDEDNAPDMICFIDSYPNPFNASTTIRYGLDEQTHIFLSVYNLVGQRVATVFQGKQDAGEHSSTWDASAFPSGVYFARLQAEGNSDTVKMLLLK